MRAVTMILLLLAVAPQAAACPWAGVDRVAADATLAEVRVGGRWHDVRGEEARRSFISLLEDCNARDAIPWFEQWRAQRRTTNTLAIVGLSGLWPVALAAPFTGLAAGTHKARMLAEIRESIPPKAPADRYVLRTRPAVEVYRDPRPRATRATRSLYDGLGQPRPDGLVLRDMARVVDAWLLAGYTSSTLQQAAAEGCAYLEAQDDVVRCLELGMTTLPAKQSCDGGHGPACTALAEHFHALGGQPGRTRHFAEQGCEAGSERACILAEWYAP